MAQSDPYSQLLFVGLLTLADRDGRIRYTELGLHGQIFPYTPELTVGILLEELEYHGFIIRYQVDDQDYIQIVNFEKHQHIHSDEKSNNYPSPNELQKPHENPTETPQKPHESTTPSTSSSTSTSSLYLSPLPPPSTSTSPSTILSRKKSRDHDSLEALPVVKNINHKNAIEYFTTKFQSIHGGNKYDFKSAKDGMAIKRMLANYGYDQLLKIIDAFFASDDEFILKAGHSITVMSSCSNKIVQSMGGLGKALSGLSDKGKVTAMNAMKVMQKIEQDEQSCQKNMKS